jgi:hypothetical protein
MDSSLIRDLEKILMTKNWTFVAPTNPLSVFLDCRTQRTFVDEEGPPHLLSEGALEYLESYLMRCGYKNNYPLILISPTPVFGFELAESVQRFLTSISGSYKWDLETWRANEKGFTKFLTYIALNFNPIYSIFLSGDVHYAFTIKAYLDNLKPTHGVTSYTKSDLNQRVNFVIPIAQLTSSPFRSNSLTNRMVAILILNLVHKIKVAKRYLLKNDSVKRSSNDVNFNYDYFKTLPEIHDLDSNSKNHYEYARVKQKNHFSKHGDDKSILEKIELIGSNLKVKYLSKHRYERNKMISHWAERRLLIKPKGQNSLPVLARNNIGYVSLNLVSKSVEHTLYFLDKKKMRSSQALIYLSKP